MCVLSIKEPIRKKSLETYLTILVYMIWFGSFYVILTIVRYLMPNPRYAYILDIWDLVWLGFGISTVVVYLMLNPL